MTDEIVTDYQHVINEFQLIMGTKGTFEFKVDGELLFSKKQLGRHAAPGEVLNIFKEFIGPDVPVYARK